MVVRLFFVVVSAALIMAGPMTTKPPASARDQARDARVMLVQAVGPSGPDWSGWGRQ